MTQQPMPTEALLAADLGPGRAHRPAVTHPDRPARPARRGGAQALAAAPTHGAQAPVLFRVRKLSQRACTTRGT